MNACTQCPVREAAVCRSLDKTALAELGRMGRRRQLHSGDVLQWEGDESSLIGNVIEGMLKLSASTRKGKEQTLGLAYAGDFIGRPFDERSGLLAFFWALRNGQFDDPDGAAARILVDEDEE